MKVAALVLELCHQMGWPGGIGHCPLAYRARAEFAAPLLLEHAKAIDPLILGAVLIKESSMRTHAAGKDGEIGIGQVKPDGASVRLCQGLDLHEPRENVACAVRLLVSARRKCGPDPLDYLGRYKGWRACGPTEYARRVLAIRDGRGREVWVRTRPGPR